MDDQDPCQKEPNPHAAHPLQEYVEFQLHPRSGGHHHIKLFKTPLRHHRAKLRQLPGQHPILREPPTQGKHELPGPNAHQGHNPTDPGDEDKELDGVLQLPDGDSGV